MRLEDQHGKATLVSVGAVLPAIDCGHEPSAPRRLSRSLSSFIEEKLQMTSFNFGSSLPAMVLATALATVPGVAAADQVTSSAGSASATTYISFDVSGIDSVGAFGDVQIRAFAVSAGVNSKVVGIGWDLTLFTDAPCWLSELEVGMGCATFNVVNLRPGIDREESRTMSFSSGGRA
jgi:hypothetical protein